MNYERGFPLPHYINPELESWIPDVNGIGPDLDSWIPVGNGPVGHRDSWTPIGQENGTRIMQNVENGNPIIPSNMYSQGNENQNGNGNENQNGNGSSSWAPMTPGKPIPTRSNTVTNGNELETENWGDLLGIYQDFLQKKTLNLNEVAQDQYQNNENRIRVSSIAKRNLNPILNSTPVPNLNPKPNHDSRSVSCFPSEDPSNWDGNLLAAIVRPVLGSGSGPIVNGPQNNSVHDLSRTPVVPNQQSHITGGYNSKQLPSDGFPVPYRPCYNLNSPPRSELDVASSDITGPTQFTPITPESKQKSTESQWVPANNEQESQRIEESTSSAVSPQKEQLVTKEGDDELGIDLNKTPNQKTPARRKKHRPKVIREGKKKKTATPKEPKTATPKEPKTATPNDTPVKRKYVRKNQQENGVEIEKSPKVKRKYVRKTPVDQSNSQQETRMEKPAPQIVETPTKSCKRQLNFDLECVAGNESQTKVNPSINLNDNPRDTEQERRINNILERSAMKVAQNNMYTGVTARMQNEPDELNVASNRGHALNMLARNLSMRNTGSGQPVWRNGYNQVSQQEPKGHIVNFDDRRGVKRPSLDQINPRHLNSMDNIYMYQKLLLGGDGARSNELTRIAESQKRTKMQNDVFTPRPDSVYGNISALQFLNSCTGRVNPSYQVNGRHSQPSMVAAQSFQKLPESSRMQQLIERTQRSNQGYGVQSMTAMVSWNRPPATPPKDYGRSAVVPYPTTPVDKKTRTPYSNSQRSNGTNKTMLQLQKEGLEAHQISFRKPRGAPRKPKGGVMVSVEDLTCMLEQLCIDKDKNALVPYKGSNNAIIPFEPIKRRKQRPKVDLDPESDRLWRLLMGKEGSEGDEKLDKDKEKWWENERRVFRGRAESFIARMHLVQGDRRFSRWKGSVVDSVIGVFLTQNVSDHLSSSAFMALAAKFAFKSTTTNKTHSTHGACVLVEQPIEIIRQPVFNQNSFTSLTKLKTTSEEVILSQDSLDSSTIQTVDEIRSSSGSNSEAEDQNLGFETSKKPAEKVSMFKELFSQENRTQQYMHHLPKTSTQIPAINGLNNMTAGFQMPPQDRQYDFLSGVDHQPPVKQKQDSGSEDRVSSVNNKQNSVEASSNGQNYGSHDPVNGPGPEKRTPKGKKVNVEDEKFDWDSLRRDVFMKCEKSERSEDAKDSLDYEALRRAHVNEISDAIRERGMNNLLADRIKDFLDRLVRDHGSIDLEWLRDAPPDKAKDYLLSIRGLGLKSVECVRLLTLHHLAFPVDTNVGRIAVRLGWVPLQPLPESLQLHLLEMYPVLESIQKYLWPRLCKLDQLTLYELHYQMITFGKVFCTKSKPNCNACPMKGECRHFASAFASARLSLPGPEEKRVVPSNTPNATHTTTAPIINNRMQLPPTEYNNNGRQISCQPIIEEPKTPEPEPAELLSISDIEDQYYEDDDEIPIIELDMKEFTTNLQKMQESMEIQGDMSKALVALNPRAASLPTQKLKNVSRLRTEHQVYEIPDTHPILQGLYKRESDDPSPYLLAIWTPGETATSMQPPERGCQAQESGMLCDRTTCFSCNCIKEANSQVVRGTILMPCRTAMRGSFPLNGTYFQVNEMFADHASSLSPIEVPRAWIWSLPRRTVYFGTSVSTIFKGLTTQEIQQCFWRGFVCVRGFDQKLRAPRPLMARLHFPASKLVNNNKTKNEDK